MSDTTSSNADQDGTGLLGRAFGKVMGLLRPSASASKLIDQLPADADDDLPVRGAKKRGREDETSVTAAVAPSNRRGKAVERMEESSDDSSVDEPLEPVATKKRRGRDYKEPLEEAVVATPANGAKKLVEKAKRAAKASGASRGASRGASSSKPPISSTKDTTSSAKKGAAAPAKRGGAKNAKVEALEASEDSDVSEESGSVDESEEVEDELDLSVEEEDVTVKWPPMPTKVEKGVSYYSWVEIDGVRVSRGDSVYLRSGDAGSPYVGKLVELKRKEDEDDSRTSNPTAAGSTCTIDWWYRKGDVEEEMAEKELIESSHRESNPILSIATSKKPKIIFGNDAKTKKEASTHADTYFYYRFFDTASSKVQVL